MGCEGSKFCKVSKPEFACHVHRDARLRTDRRPTSEDICDHPILFLLRQNGTAEKGWRGTPFYWPVIRGQSRTPTAIYTADTVN